MTVLGPGYPLPKHLGYRRIRKGYAIIFMHPIESTNVSYKNIGEHQAQVSQDVHDDAGL